MFMTEAFENFKFGIRKGLLIFKLNLNIIYFSIKKKKKTSWWSDSSGTQQVRSLEFKPQYSQKN
jgi:hypothetical protein